MRDMEGVRGIEGRDKCEGVDADEGGREGSILYHLPAVCVCACVRVRVRVLGVYGAL